MFAAKPAAEATEADGPRTFEAADYQGERYIAAVAGRVAADGKIDGDSLVDLAPFIHDGKLAWQVPAGGSFADPGATAMDLCAGDLTASINASLTVNISVPGTYTNTFTVADPSGNSAQTNRIVTVVLPAPPLFGTCTVSAPGQFRLQGTGIPGLTYTLQTSTNLVDWVNHTNLVPGPDGLIDYSDQPDPAAPACFYRLRWP